MPSHQERVKRNYRNEPVFSVAPTSMACPMCQRGQPCAMSERLMTANVIEGEHFDTNVDHGDETT